MKLVFLLVTALLTIPVFADEKEPIAPPSQAAFLLEWIELDHRKANKLVRLPHEKGRLREQPIKFSELIEDQTLIIDHDSDGCFHKTATRFEFTGKQLKITQKIPKGATPRIVQLDDADLKNSTAPSSFTATSSAFP